MSEHEQDELQFPGADDARPREEKKNQPHYLGDKVDRAVHRMEEEGEPMSERAQALVEEGEAELRRIVDDAEAPPEEE